MDNISALCYYDCAERSFPARVSELAERHQYPKAKGVEDGPIWKEAPFLFGKSNLKVPTVEDEE